MLIVTYIRHAICYISFHVAVNFNVRFTKKILQWNSACPQIPYRAALSLDRTHDFRTQTPLLDHIILCLRSVHDQDAEGVEEKGNGDDSSALEARQTTSCIFRKLHCASKKFPPLKSLTLSVFNRFSNFLQCWKANEIYYKATWHYPHHLRHVATLPWEIKNANFLQTFSTYGSLDCV